ncbi:hypothetical protein FHR23_003174 [Stakelama sediminis]|uniref:Uncharacterized protein n=1 Tax=Stakelama sediminis TaxID=463200 RepID=A0A840Z246_9SPHN|nr:hypothetical protein [Stakelama sediminis]
MNILLQVVSLLLTASSSAPPHAPNFCGQTFCLELQPMLHSERRGFVPIERDSVELGGRTWMRLRYADLGTVSVVGPFASSSMATVATIDEQTDEITVNSCMVADDPETCGRYLISISDNGVANKPLVCSVVSFWVARPEENSPGVRMGQRVDIGQQLAKRCL